MGKVKFVNTTGYEALKMWIAETAKPDCLGTHRQAMAAWCDEAEQAIISGKPPMVEMKARHSRSGFPETFTVPDAGITTC